MFKKTKETPAGIVVLNDEDGPQDDFYSGLGLNKKVDEGPSKEELQNMTTEQLDELISSSAQSGKESTARALRIALEAREIGAATAATMQQQTAQLENMSEQIEVVHDYLDKSERTLERMTKSKIVRIFQRKKPLGKGLDKVKGTRKEQDARQELRNKGLDSLDMKAMESSDSTMRMHDLQREELLDAPAVSGSKLGWLGKKIREPAPRLQTRAVQEDYSAYSSSVAQVLKQQDEDLDQIGDALSDMKAMATAMNNELEYQGELIEEVQTFSTETSKRTKENAKKIARIK